MPHSISTHTLDAVQKRGDCGDDLFRAGFVVVKGVISPEKSQGYIQSMLKWLEQFPFGLDRNHPKTWSEEGGMYHGYAVQHEKFMWEVRQEPKVIEAFSKLWATDKLLVSFDGMNLTLPSKSRQPTEPWPHVDQSPSRVGLHCIQGILNFAPNGHDDGGLLVLKGSHTLNEDFFKSHCVLGRKTSGPPDWFGFEQSEGKWFEDRGCELLKVCADPGDVILWDSRTVHYNALPKSQKLRALIYACYTPASFAMADDVATKANIFEQWKGTTHWPHANIFPNDRKKLRLGKPDVNERDRPFEEPEETETVLKLAGKLAY